MSRIFGENNPIVEILNKATDLLLLNLVIALCCLPIVTAGAAFTAGHFALLRVRRSEGNALPDFWQSFRENFRQATAVWLAMLGIDGAALALLWFFGKESIAVSIGCFLILLIVFLVGLWAFPLLSKFVNSTVNIVRNAGILSIRYLFRTLAMLVIMLLPGIIIIFVPYTIAIILIFGISVPIYLCGGLYNKIFASLESDVLKNLRKEEE